MKQIVGLIRIDNMIDIITNSSSELFIIENNMAVPMLVELVNTAFNGKLKISEYNIEGIFNKDEYANTNIDEILDNFPESDREMLRTKYFTDPRWYKLSLDRDWIYRVEREIPLRKILTEIGFETY